MAEFDKIVVVTKQTALEALQERFGTIGAARFTIEHATAEGVDFAEYESSHAAYARALEALHRAIPSGVRTQLIERSFLPNFSFGEHDLVVTLGPDGLVVNTGKYLSGQPILAFNPDPQRNDGVLLPFRMEQAAGAFRKVLAGLFTQTPITMAQAKLNDGQVLYGVNDLFVGRRTHVSARYQLRFRGAAEDQSSSGIIISTGAGSTGWFRSVITGASEVMEGFFGVKDALGWVPSHRLDWSAEVLYFSVREPFVSRVSSADVAFGRIEPGEQLEIISQMPQDGVIFSDGVEADTLTFNSGAIATIGVADQKVQLITRAWT